MSVHTKKSQEKKINSEFPITPSNINSTLRKTKNSIQNKLIYLHCFNKNCKLIPQITFLTTNTLSLRCPCTEGPQTISISMFLELMETYQNENLNKYRMKCPIHNTSKRDEPYIVYCKTCYLSLCSKCIAEHCNHEIISIEEMKRDFNFIAFSQLFEEAVDKYKTEINTMKSTVLKLLEEEKKRIEDAFRKNKEFNQNIISLFLNTMNQNEETPNDYHTMSFLNQNQNFHWKSFPIEEFDISKENLKSLYSYLENTSIIYLDSNSKTPTSLFSKQFSNVTPITKKIDDFTPKPKTLTSQSKKTPKDPTENKFYEYKSPIPTPQSQHSQNSQKTPESIQTPLVQSEVSEIRFLQRAEIHESGITCICKIDKDRFATSSRDCSIRVFTFDPSPKIKLNFHIDNAHLNGVSYLCPAMNNTLISSGYDKTIRIWEISLKHYKLKQTLDGHSKCVYHVLTLTNNRFASCSEDKTIRIWDFNNNYSLKETFFGHRGVVTSIIQRKNQEILVSGSTDNNLIFWDIIKYRKVNVIENVYCVCQTSMYEFGEGILLVGGRSVVKVINMDMGIVTGEIKDTFFRGLKIFTIFSIGVRILIGSEDGRIAITELNAEKFITKMKDVHDDFISGIIIADAKTIITASFDKSLKIWTF